MDLGTTFTAAAVRVGRRPTMVGLGNRALQIPSVLLLTPEGHVLVGESAERRGRAEPHRLVREFKRRFGDPVPVVVGGTPCSAETLTAELLRHVVSTTTERMGSAPELVVLTHPVSWGPYKLRLLAEVARLAGVSPVVLRPEPVAAAAQFASRSPLAVGSVVAVYDFGGGTFDACVLRRTTTGFVLLGQPGGVEHLGGLDLDEAVFAHVLGVLGDRVEGLDHDDPATVQGLARLRRECVEAKEALSADSDTVIPVALPMLSTTVRLTRVELETLVRPALTRTVEVLARTLRSADVTPEQLTAVVLIGGSSRIPLVGEVLQREFATPVAVDTHPKHDVALGALLELEPGDAAPAQPLPTQPLPAQPLPAQPPPAQSSPASEPTPPAVAGRGPWRRRVVGLVALLVIAGLTATVLALRATDGPEAASPVPASTGPASTPSPLPTACGSVEEFDGADLGAGWTRTRADADLRVADGSAALTAPDGADLYRDRISAAMLLQQRTGDFTLEAVVRAEPGQVYQGAGLVLRSGANSYVRLELGFFDVRGLGFEYQDRGPHVWVHSPRRGPTLVQTSASLVVLQLSRTGQTVTARWRPVDEPGLRELGAITVAFPSTISAGLSVVNRAQREARPAPFTARFDRVVVAC